MGDQLGYALESGIPLMVLFGDEELTSGMVKVKDMAAKSGEGGCMHAWVCSLCAGVGFSAPCCMHPEAAATRALTHKPHTYTVSLLKRQTWWRWMRWWMTCGGAWRRWYYIPIHQHQTHRPLLFTSTEDTVALDALVDDLRRRVAALPTGLAMVAGGGGASGGKQQQAVQPPAAAAAQ